MLERQREGIAKAKREGRYQGRVPTTRRQAAEIIRLRADGVTAREIAVRLGVGRARVYRVLSGGGDRVAALSRSALMPRRMICPAHRTRRTVWIDHSQQGPRRWRRDQCKKFGELSRLHYCGATAGRVTTDCGALIDARGGS